MNKNIEVIKIGLSGASGRVGKTIVSLIQKTPGFSASAFFSQNSPLEKWRPKEVDVVIDFSNPQALKSLIPWCEKHKKPLISGTTGLSKADHLALNRLAKNASVLWAPNMSLGIACLNQWLEQLPPAVKQWPVEIEETHHRHKKDNPSGTALLLLNTLEQAGLKQVKVKSFRKGDVFGVHLVSFQSKEEKLEIKHTALNRGIFAQGALLAGRWIYQKPPGLYSMKDFFLSTTGS